MNNNNHKHITHDEIEKYVNTTEEELFQEDITFFEDFDDRLENCEVCSKRFRVYALISSIVDTEDETI